MKNIKISVIMIFALLLSVGLFAQRGGRHYKPYNHYNYQRNHVSVNVIPGYHYRPNYRPVPRYRPIYRTPGTYVHFGPAFGVRVNVLPFGYSRIFAGSNPYFYNDGVFYRPYNNNQYEVVAPPLHATVKKLPANAAVTVIDGQKYYQVGGTFYREEFDKKNKLRYRVVGTDGVINTDETNSAEVINGTEDLNALDEAIPTIGSRYDELPADSKVQIINRQKYMVAPSGIYYKEVIEGDKLRYEVTGVQ